MKKKVIIVVAIIAVVAVGVFGYFYMNQSRPSVGVNNSITNEDGKSGTTTLDSSKVLVVYFTYGGNTQKLAKEVSDQVGGDLRRIETVEAYPGEDEIYDLSKEEQDNDERPAIQDLNIDISQYDTIFVGYPIWWYTYPQVILSFFDNYDMTGKTIIPFVTHGGSGMSGTEGDMEEYLAGKDVTILEGLAVSRNDIENDQKQTVTNWLQELNLID